MMRAQKSEKTKHNTYKKMSIDQQLGSRAGIADFVIFGMHPDGTAFQMTDNHSQHGDWADHLCSILGSFSQDGRFHYSAYVRPAVICNTRSVVVRTHLSEVDPDAYRLVEQFVREHNLKVRAGRSLHHHDTDIPHPAERRDPQRNAW
jgi:hypothetical protein